VSDIGHLINRRLPAVERSCLSKAFFVSRREARSMARNGRRSNGQLKPYRCRYGEHWHLGHRPQWRTKAGKSMAAAA
jgi:hypothetical protein